MRNPSTDKVREIVLKNSERLPFAFLFLEVKDIRTSRVFSKSYSSPHHQTNRQRIESFYKSINGIGKEPHEKR